MPSAFVRTPTSRIRRAVALALGATLLIAGPAGAHPSVRGGEAPVDSLATLTLAMAHGCASETAGEGDPTSDVSLEVPEWLRVVEVPAPEGWAVDLEAAQDGSIAVVTWTADGAEEPAPDFDLDVVVSGEVGEVRYLRVFQACDDFVYRWVGTPDDPADDPAVRLTLTAADPASPPPPEPEADEPAPDPDSDDPAAAEPDPADGEATDDAEATGDGEDPGSDGSADGADPDADADDADLDGDPAAADDADDAIGVPGWLLPVTVIVLLGGLGLLVFGRRGRGAS